MAIEPKAEVERLGAALSAALEDNLVSFCLYGPAVRHDVPQAKRELTTLLVLRDVSPDALQPMHGAVADWTKRGNPPPLIFSERGWRDSTDVFPIEVEDMREAHLLVRGGSPFDGMTTSRDDLRTELERELRGKLLQLRTEYVAAAPDGKALDGLLIQSLGTFFILFRAVLRLVGQDPPQQREPLMRATAEATHLDAEAFEWPLARMAGQRVRKLAADDPVASRYLEQLERLAQFVDSWR